MSIITINPDKLKPRVPDTIPLWAARAILQEQGLLDQANNLVVNSSNTVLKNVWEYGNFISRNSPALAQLSGALGLSDDQIDEMFIAANSIVV